MVSGQFHYTKRNVFMPFLLVEILNFQGSAHLRGVGSLSKLVIAEKPSVAQSIAKVIGADKREDRYLEARRRNQNDK